MRRSVFWKRGSAARRTRPRATANRQRVDRVDTSARRPSDRGRRQSRAPAETRCRAHRGRRERRGHPNGGKAVGRMCGEPASCAATPAAGRRRNGRPARCEAGAERDGSGNWGAGRPGPGAADGGAKPPVPEKPVTARRTRRWTGPRIDENTRVRVISRVSRTRSGPSTLPPTSGEAAVDSFSRAASAGARLSFRSLRHRRATFLCA